MIRRIVRAAGLARLRRLVFGLAGLIAMALRAEVTLGPLFSDGAVLQREKPIPIWGTSVPGELVTVSFAGQTRTATADKDGRWLVVLDPLSVSTVGSDLTVTSGKNTVTLHDIVVGDVWLCSGQSNMEFTVSRGLNAAGEEAAAQFPLVRHIAIQHQESDTPSDRVGTSGWKPAIPANVGSFSAVGYFFARELTQKLGIPIGLVQSTYSGTPIEAWMSPMGLASNPAFGVVGERWHADLAAYPTAKSAYEKRLAAWTPAEEAAKKRGAKIYAAWLKQNPKPSPPHGPGDSWTPSGLFNGMINPLLPFALRGVLWYQGESNTRNAAEYHALFATMITAWRAHLGQGDVPFYWVNLANFRPADDATDQTWAWLREAQTKTLTLPNTGQAIAIDIGDPNDIHPKNKQEVGRRLALLAKHRLFNFTADDSGPVFATATREGTGLRVRFSEVGSGLVSHDKPPQALELAGPDRVFHPASGRIDRDTLIVFSSQVKDPVAVRYAWHNAPDANLYGGTGLPVVPFRSDDW